MNPDPLDTWKQQEEDRMIARSEDREACELRNEAKRLRSMLKECVGTIDMMLNGLHAYVEPTSHNKAILKAWEQIAIRAKEMLK